MAEKAKQQLWSSMDSRYNAQLCYNLHWLNEKKKHQLNDKAFKPISVVAMMVEITTFTNLRPI